MRRPGGRKEIEVVPQGLVTKEILEVGEGDELPPKGTTVTVHYTGRLENGQIFDSSRNKGRPFKFVLGARNVILGWDLAVATMKKKERSKVKITPDYGYGNRDVGVIPPKSTLIFDIELLSWGDKEESSPSGFLLTVMIIIIMISIAAFVVHASK